jgi:putative phage-type endonuclease
LGTATATALPLRQNTPAWVDARRDFVGSSDLPVITGNTPYGTSAFSLWAIKTRLAEPDPVDPETQELFDLGHLLEDDIAERYTAKTGREVRRANLMRARKDIPWASANLDRVSAVRGERRVVEVKWVPHRHWLAEPERVPSYVQDQVQWQLFVTGWDVADVAVLDGSRVFVHEVGPNRAYQEDLLYIARWFRDLVVRGAPPPIDGSEATRRTLSRLHPRPTQDLLIASPEIDAVVHDYREARAAAKAASSREDELANVIRGLIGDHMGVEGDGYKISWLKNADSTRVDWKLVAQNQRRLLELIGGTDPASVVIAAQAEGIVTSAVSLDELLNAIESLHSKTTEGPRVLRPRFRNEETGAWT